MRSTRYGYLLLTTEYFDPQTLNADGTRCALVHLLLAVSNIWALTNNQASGYCGLHHACFAYRNLYNHHCYS